jgi:hypothetical protein
MPPITPQPEQFLVVPIQLTDLIAFYRKSDVKRPLYLPYGQLLTILQEAINGGTGTGILLQTNNTTNPVQDILNLIEGTGITITDNGAGGITFDVTGINSVDNGLSPKSGDPNVFQLGGTLIKDTTIDDSTFDLAITKSNSGTALFVINYDTGYGLYARSDEGIASVHAIFPSTTSGIETVMEVRRGSTLNATGGIYGAIDFYTRTTVGNERSGRIVNGWAVATDAIRTSQTFWYGVQSGTEKVLMSLRGSGDFKLNEYGTGVFEDTPDYLAGFTGDGSVIEVDIATIFGNYVPYTGAAADVDLGAFDITAASIIKSGGTSSEFLKADGSVDNTAYAPETRTITINGNSQDLSADRTWTTVWKDVTTGTASSGNSITVSKTQLIQGGTFAVGDIIQVDFGSLNKTGSNGAFFIRAYVNTTANLSGSPIVVALLTGSNVQQGLRRLMELVIKSSTVTEIASPTSSYSTDFGLILVTNVNIDWTTDKYFVFTIQTASASDSCAISYYRIQLT